MTLSFPGSCRIVSALFSSLCEDTWVSDCLRTLVDLLLSSSWDSSPGLWPVRLHGSPHSPFSSPAFLFKSATSKQNTRDYNIQIKWQYTNLYMQSDSNYTNTGKRNANTSSSISTGRIIFFILFNIFYIWGQGGGPVLLIQADFPWSFVLFCFRTGDC